MAMANGVQNEQRRRKRDRIHSLIHRSRFSGSNQMVSQEQWAVLLAKSLTSMQKDVEEILNRLEKAEHVNLKPTEPKLLTQRSISLRTHQQSKVLLVRLAETFYLPTLLTHHSTESTFPYTDILEDVHSNEDTRSTHNKTVEPVKLRYRIERLFDHIDKDTKRFKLEVYGRKPSTQGKEFPSFHVLNYRTRLHQNLLNMRHELTALEHHRKIEESNTEKSQRTLSDTSVNDNQHLKQAIENFHLKLRPTVTDFIFIEHSFNLSNALPI